VKSAFDKIAAGLGDAIAYARGDESRGRETSLDVRAIRKAVHKTQEQFAATYHVPIGTLRDWEQKRRQPESASATLLRMIATDPKGVERILSKLDDAA